ncbi:MAG: hypothetical protein QOK21_4215 [Solirubrobacteraceae bacterium]|jgi:hypothetical protein|nr:hypothetical protein [Solirubrobacteraceae bacterium]
MRASTLPRRCTSALTLTAVVIATGLAAPSPAQTASPGSSPRRTPSPSASGLWRTYPLRPGRPKATRAATTPVADRTAARAPARAAARPRQSAAQDSAWSPLIVVMIVVLAAATIAIWTVVLLRRRRRATPGAAPNDATGRSRQGAAPPDQSRAWTAGIDWIEDGNVAHFRVVARAADGSEAAPILRSAVLPWPPADSGAVDAMTQAVEQLEGRLLDAGWTPAEPGPVWYEKYFAWAPKRASARAPKRPAPKRTAQPATRRAARPKPPRPAATAAAPAEKRSSGWPPDASALWRCEIRFDAGYSASRFTATVHPPDGSDARSRIVARSQPLRWLFMSPPDSKAPEHRGAALALARALRAAGWEVVGRGGGWYAERYVWRGVGEPPAHIEVPELTEQRKGETA